MTSIILAGVLGAVTIVIVVLLFRRLREDLNRQLTAISAERDSEWIMRVIISAPHGTTAPPGGSSPQAAAANGDLFNPPPSLPDPLRGQRPLVSRKHLHLLPPIAAAAVALAEFLREVWREHRGYVLGTAIGGLAAGTAAVTVLTIAPWEDRGDFTPPSSAPTAAPTITLPPPTYIWPPQPTPGESGPSQTPSPSPSTSAIAGESGTASPESSATVVPIGEEPTAPPGSPTETGPGPSGETPTEPGTEEPPAAVDSSPPAAAPSSPPPSETPGGSGLCIGVTVSPILDIGTCLPFLGGG